MKIAELHSAAENVTSENYMNLNEFFGNIDTKHQVKKSKDNHDPRDDLNGKTKIADEHLMDELYWFILDNDDLHKEHFMPLAQEIYSKQKNKEFNHGDYVKKWMPMVKAGCKEFYKKSQLQGHPDDLFTREMRLELCKRLADQHHEDIAKGEYDLGL